MNRGSVKKLTSECSSLKLFSDDWSMNDEHATSHNLIIDEDSSDAEF